LSPGKTLEAVIIVRIVCFAALAWPNLPQTTACFATTNVATRIQQDWRQAAQSAMAFSKPAASYFNS
jgi:hypothetical protein